MKKEERIQTLLKKIIEWSEDNTSGLIINKCNLRTLIEIFEDKIYSGKTVTKDMIEYKLPQFESDRGYLIKSSDILSVITMYKFK